MVQYLDNAFASLSDPTRRDILHRLTQGELSASVIASQYNMTLTAVLKHLRILEKAQLIVLERRGRQQFARLSSNAFKDTGEYIQNYELLLGSRLDALGQYLKEGSMDITAPTPNRQKLPQAEEHVLRVTHTIDAPREAVWDAYTNPKHVPMWWGPRGVQLKECTIEPYQGGIWRFSALGSNKKVYVFSGIFREVSRLSRLVYTDGMDDPLEPRPEAIVTVTLEELPDGKTQLTKTSIAPLTVHQFLAAGLGLLERSSS